MGTPLRKITRSDRLATLVKNVRKQRVAEAKKEKRTPRRREARLAQFEHRRGVPVASKLDEATLNAVEAIFYVSNGALDAKDVLGLSTDDALRIARFGMGLLSRDDATSAEACGHVATKVAPKEPLGWLVLGAASARQRKDMQAIIAYQQATLLAPNTLHAWVDLGELYVRRMELALGAKALQRALELDPEAKDPVTQRAQLLIVNTLMTLEER